MRPLRSLPNHRNSHRSFRSLGSAGADKVALRYLTNLMKKFKRKKHLKLENWKCSDLINIPFKEEWGRDFAGRFRSPWSAGRHGGQGAADGQGQGLLEGGHREVGGLIDRLKILLRARSFH